MLPHTELINWVIKKKGFKSYMEIGLHRLDQNFDLIDCEFKIGCDPSPQTIQKSGVVIRATSDEYFGSNFFEPPKVDCAFIDGLHWSEQVKKDFENCLNYLNDNGVIFIHDTDPKDARYAVYPRQEPRRWNGDVMLFLPELAKYPVDWKTPDVDANGLTVVKRKNRPGFEFPHEIKDWSSFREHREELLQLCTRQEFEQWV